MTTQTDQDNKDEEKIKTILSGFERKYHKVLLYLDRVHQGTFDEEDAQGVASLCLLALAALDEEGKSTEFRARSLKKDIEFAEASAYSVLKNSKIDGKKPSEAALAQLVVLDPDVQRISKEQIEAERDAKHLSTIQGILKEAHLTFRSMKKGV